MFNLSTIFLYKYVNNQIFQCNLTIVIIIIIIIIINLKKTIQEITLINFKHVIKSEALWFLRISGSDVSLGLHDIK